MASSSSSSYSSDELEHLSIEEQQQLGLTTTSAHNSDRLYNAINSSSRGQYNRQQPTNNMGVVPLSIDDDDNRRRRIPPSPLDDQQARNSLYFEREGESEYYYIEEETRQPPQTTTKQRPTSESSDSATIHFYTDDRVRQTDEFINEIEEEDDDFGEQTQRAMSVDYSANDFQRSLAAINAASRGGSGADSYATGGVRVRKEGDTTIMTEHRDPYSFYWQLDKARRQEVDPYRPPPSHDYVIDEELVVEDDENKYVLSVHL